MKSTGLFGKNSGRVGGVVYSNYRGEQVVRAYQPQVKNPNTKGQIAQRAKFKLVSQLAAVFGKELKNSFVSNDSKITSRNAWVRKMLRYATYSGDEASLPIEDIVLTNATGGIVSAAVESGRLNVILPAESWDINRVKVRGVLVAYSDGGEITPLAVLNALPIEQQPSPTSIILSENIGSIPQNFGNIRMIVYAYEPNSDVLVSYEDYDVQGEEATLSDIVRSYGLTNVRFSESRNIVVPQNV